MPNDDDVRACDDQREEVLAARAEFAKHRLALTRFLVSAPGCDEALAMLARVELAHERILHEQAMWLTIARGVRS